jgi:Mycotoxin biosynthesis protein UstYa
MFTFSKSKASFSSLRQEDSEDGVEHDQMLDHHTYDEERNRSRSHRFWSSNIPWIITTIVLSIYIIATSIYHKRTTTLCNPTDLRKQLSTFLCQIIFLTDVAIARPYIEESFRTMTAGLDYHTPNGTLQATPAPGPRYVGPPSPEIDAAWMELAGSKFPKYYN